MLGCVAVLALLGLVAAQPTPSAGATLCLHVGYGGNCVNFPVGDHAGVSGAFGRGGGEASSVALAPGYGITLFSGGAQNGQQSTVTSTTHSFFSIAFPTGGNWNDKAFSWTVFELPPTTTPVPTTPAPPTPFNCSLLAGWDPSLPLIAEGEPIFSADESGFVFLNRLEIVWYNPVKFALASGTIYEEFPTAPVCVPGIIGNTIQVPNGPVHPSECYQRCSITSEWTNFMNGPEKFIDSTSNPAISLVRGKLSTNNTETFDAGFRGEPVTTRVILSDMPFEITFPNTVSGNLAELEAFLPPGVVAALILQSVDVDVSTLSTDGKAIVRTQVQWPFKFLTGASDYSVNTVDIGGKNIGVSVSLVQDCADPGIVDDTAGDSGTTAPPCDQIWEISLTPGPQVCDLDGDYNLDFAATCQPAFVGGGNCPLIGASGQLEGNLANILFTLDTENFCPQVIEEVQISAAVAAYKDVGLTQAATNFIIDENIFFGVVVTSPLVSLASVTVSTIRVDYQNGNNVLEYDLAGANDCSGTPAGSPIGSACNLEEFVIDNTGDDRASFSFKLSTPPFAPPVDGDEDFNVEVELDVTYVGINLLGEEEVRSVKLLQNAGSASSRAAVSSKLGAAPGDASSAAMVSAAAALVGGLVVLA